MHVSKAIASTVYFAYGSNLWLEQMTQRCPTSSYLGIARLNDYRWMINSRGYANVVSSDPPPLTTSNAATTDTASFVYGMVYSLLPTDEARLDVNEGVPNAYTKEYLSVDFWPCGKNDSDTVVVDIDAQEAQKIDMLVYIDRVRTVDSTPKKEYIYRMNMGIADALRMGVPRAYVDDVMRRFIPAPEEVGEDRDSQELAGRQALKFQDEGVLST
ncbi:MAG: hypothetical protein M1816_005752 [Peltula sp. TS41687]|nr:MAG: hypothetical protein M1816_005752 [Peltula sp. TS41687]